MKRILVTLALLSTLGLSAFGGEVSTPGIVDPTPSPTPCETCQTGSNTVSTDTSEAEIVTADILWILAGLVWP